MTVRKTRPQPPEPVQVPFPAWAMQADAGQQQMAVAAQSAGAVMRGFEAMRKVNDRAVQAALARYTTAASKFGGPRQPIDLLTIPSELVRSEFESAATYWQELTGAAMEMQAELMGCSSHLIDSDALLQAASAMDALPAFNGFNSFFGTRRASPA